MTRERMEMTDPYTERIMGLLGDRKAVETLEVSLGRLDGLLARLTGPTLDRSYGPDKWTARQILVHLADVEMVVGFRIRQALAEDDYTVQAIDPDRWMEHRQTIDGILAAHAFMAMRRWNLALISCLEEADLARPALHPERGPEPVGSMIDMLAGHDLNHLAQLEQIAKG